ncbi:DUF4296 domain-containing protein [Sphingobacterium faecale]|uniref:DUF4296 domain-containing protein n=1 Tax=Sphingobacterium faecale TaxID=2803775 RepID=A0ABS1R2I7_9SPHI|nr:DUF4296 domain-containing protein [Sphingobacterium faecale]MBL1408913.1 DUF4296 domain-containing protein [Sphingobacterium faecale]
MSEKEMTELMTEVSLVDAYLNTLPIDSGRKVMPVLYEHAFRKYKLDSALFIQNLDYYLGSPILTEKIYTNINKTLSEKERGYQQQDSVRNVILQDSIQQAMRLQRYTAMMKDLITNVHLDSTLYTYTQYGADFLTKADLQVNAYGIQVPVITPPPPVLDRPKQEEEKVEEEYLDTVKGVERPDTSRLKKVLRKPTN